MIRSAYGYKTLEGLIFGQWTVLGDGYIKNKNRVVPVKCICGKQKEVYFQTIVRGESQSCGCISSIKAKERLLLNPISQNLPNSEAAKNALLSSYKNKAKKRELSWELSNEQFFNLTASNCFYCNAEPCNIKKTQYKTGEYKYNGIDRVNNKNGYTVRNVVSCCKICNVAKGEMSLDEFLIWIKKVFNNKMVK